MIHTWVIGLIIRRKIWPEIKIFLKFKKIKTSKRTILGQILQQTCSKLSHSKIFPKILIKNCLVLLINWKLK